MLGWTPLEVPLREGTTVTIRKKGYLRKRGRLSPGTTLRVQLEPEPNFGGF